MTDEVRTVSSTGGRKGQKLARHSLLPVEQIRQLAEHYGKGAAKYTERDGQGNIIHDGSNNWRLGYPWSLSFDSAKRHLDAFWAGEDWDDEFDPPSKHLIAAAWHCLCLAEFMDRFPGFDDRFTYAQSKENDVEAS